MKALFALSTVGAVLVSATVVAVQQSPVFRSEANFVEVTVRVTDKAGHFVDGLTASDFALREDTRLERVENVFQIHLPTRWDSTPARTTVLYRPDMPRELQFASGRIYLLFLNAVQAQHVPITRRIARDFVDNYLMPEDVVAIWSEGGGLVQFTNEPVRIHQAIDGFLGTSDMLTKPVAGTGDMGRFDPKITSALKWFSSVQGRRKSMLLFSAGWSGIAPVFSDRVGTISSHTELVDRLDVQIYLVDTRGLIANAPRPRDLAANLYSDYDNSSRELDEMRWLAEDTGGFAVVNHNSYRDSFKRIVDENSRYYVLGYQSSARSRSNWDYREISVKVVKPGLEGVKVQARKGYVAR